MSPISEDGSPTRHRTTRGVANRVKPGARTHDLGVGFWGMLALLRRRWSSHGCPVSDLGTLAAEAGPEKHSTNRSLFTEGGVRLVGPATFVPVFSLLIIVHSPVFLSWLCLLLDYLVPPLLCLWRPPTSSFSPTLWYACAGLRPGVPTQCPAVGLGLMPHAFRKVSQDLSQPQE